MQPAGGEARVWREAGAWWRGEPPVEVRQDGRRREQVTPLTSFAYDRADRPTGGPAREDISLRPRKTRDEKVRRACGLIGEGPLLAGRRAGVMLHIVSGYSFGRSSILAVEAARLAAERCWAAALLADRFSLAGAFEFSRECRRQGVRPLIGMTIELAEGGDLVLVAQDKTGWRSLCRLATAAHLEQPRLFPLLSLEQLEQESRGLFCLSGGDGGALDIRLARRDYEGARQMVGRLKGIFGPQRVALQIERTWLPWQADVERRLCELGREMGLPCVAGGPALHAERSHYPAQDALVCSLTLATVEEIIGRKPLRAPGQPTVENRPLRGFNAERWLRGPEEQADLYSDAPELLAEADLLVEKCDAEILPGRAALPDVLPEPGRALVELTWAGARERHGRISSGLRRRLEFELERITRLHFSPHYLLMWDACRWCSEQGILHSGRGSVVDSAVAYCLGLSRIDAHRHGLHFDRFLPDDGSKRPDIDIDFEARRREDVRSYLIEKYGREHTAGVAAFGAYCVRGIVREVGKALMLPPQMIGFLAKRIHGGVSPDQIESAMQKKPELARCGVPRERLEWVFRLAKQMMDVPRNARAHSSGLVVSREPLRDFAPLMLSGSGEFESDPGTLRILHWDKRTSKHVFDKFDLLCLRGQDVISGTEQRLRQREPDFRVEQAPLDDSETYRAMRSGQLIGIPQSASPAMRQAHIRLRTQNLTDASLVQAGIRPGVGGAVKINELIARRRGEKAYGFDHPELERILGHTYGIVVFQEQIDQLLQAFVGCSGGEAEEIREEIHKRRREDYGQVIRQSLMERMAARGLSAEVAGQVFELVAAFKGYGFAQGHALAFAEISVRSIWCQQNHPAEYFAALLDAQPAGYYGPCTLANEARSRGVRMLPPRWGRSGMRFEVEDIVSTQDPRLRIPGGGIRIPLTQINGLSKGLCERAAASAMGASVAEFVRECRPNRDELESLILVGFFDEICPHRRALLWAAPDLAQHARTGEGSLAMPLVEPALDLSMPDMAPAEKAVRERALLDMDVDRHLMGFERERVRSRGGLTTDEVNQKVGDDKIIVVGNPIRLRFPPTASGRRICFFDLEDETGLLNVTCFDDVYQRDGAAIIGSSYVTLVGRMQDRGGHAAFLARRVFEYEPHIRQLVEGVEELPLARADYLVG